MLCFFALGTRLSTRAKLRLGSGWNRNGCGKLANAVLPRVGAHLRVITLIALGVDQEDYRGNSRNFFKKVDRLAHRLKPHKAFLHEISASGGKSEIYIQLPGTLNVGDSLDPRTLGLLAELNVLLSVEVFPVWNVRSPPGAPEEAKEPATIEMRSK